MKFILTILIFFLVVACKTKEQNSTSTKLVHPVESERVDKIAQYVVDAFQDSKGNLWFGSIEKGVARYDGNTLKYYTTQDGLPSDRVIAIVEDAQGILWFGTGEGLSKYDGSSFTNYSISDEFGPNSISQLFIDSRGVFWIGTWGGVYQFDGKEFSHFPLPYPEVSTGINEDTRDWITELKEDPSGNIWIGRDGFGACKYDGRSLTHILIKDGLHSNNVTEIEFDNNGDVWFGTRVAERDNLGSLTQSGSGGVNRWDGESMSSFPDMEAFNNADVYGMHKDRSDRIWIATVSSGVYRQDGEEFKHYDVPISIMAIHDDPEGNVWLGGAGGLYRITSDDEVVYVRQNGPWE